MRTPNLGSVQFAIQDPGDIREIADLIRYVRDFEQRTARAVIALAAGHLDMLYVMPDKPRHGDIRLFDGVLANPGAGRGVYWYDADFGTWNQMG